MKSKPTGPIFDSEQRLWKAARDYLTETLGTGYETCFDCPDYEVTLTFSRRRKLYGMDGEVEKHTADEMGVVQGEFTCHRDEKCR